MEYHVYAGEGHGFRKPETVQTLLAAYNSISEAGSAVSEIIAAGIVPAAVEMMDSLAIKAAEAAVAAGLDEPLTRGSVVASDALRELQSEAVRGRLQPRGATR